MTRNRWIPCLLALGLGVALPLQAAEPQPSEETIQQGKELFHAKRCSHCHTAGGLDEAGKVSLDTYRLYADPLLFGSVLWNHAAAMHARTATDAKAAANLDPWPQFEPGELDKLVAYIHKATGSYQHQYLVGSDAAAGAKIFEERCRGCHNGQANAIGPDLAVALKGVKSRADIAGRMWNHVPAMVAAAEAQKVSIPTLTPREMADLFEHLAAIGVSPAGAESGGAKER